VAAIWIVDDEPYIRAAMVAVLEDIGHQTRDFSDAESLYRQLVDGDRPDLLILDHMLPDEDGAVVVHSLRERADYRDIPILFVTAVSDADADRLSDLAPVVRKPFDFRDLVSEVNALVPPPGPDAQSDSSGTSAR